jgi:tetratricopeptide (TPR) repeat protein
VETAVVREVESAEELMEEGFRLLKEFEFESAIRVGKRLKKLRHSSAFEILALAYAQQDAKARAIRELEDGVRRAPDVWRLWQLLGNYYSDQERYDDAQKAYQHALTCPSADEGSVYLNMAIALGRERRYPEALHALDQVTDKELALRAGSSRMGFLNALESYSEAVALGRDLLAAANAEDLADERTLASIHAELGHALWMATRDATSALAEAWEALRIQFNEPNALWLIREIRNRSALSRVISRGGGPPRFGLLTREHSFFGIRSIWLPRQLAFQNGRA